MEPIGANTVKHGGTYNGNPLCAAAALHTLRTLSDGNTIARIRAAGETVMEAIRRSARDRGVPCVVQGAGSMFQVVFNAEHRAPVHYRDLLTADTNRFAAFRQSLLEQGIHCNSSGLACWFVSAAHTDDDTAIAVEAVEKAMAVASK
jgi:glutamate-1-semialdehyde 2,1-aminomutase